MATIHPPAPTRPPHCPNPDCRHHCDPSQWRVHGHGSFIRPGDRRRVRRYRCAHCRRTFSTQTFSTTYWLRRPQLLVPIAEHVVAGSCLRQIARVQRTSHATVGRHLARVARQCLLVHHDRLRRLAIRESVVFDGFESFEYSQYFPLHLHLAVGAESWFIYHFTDSPLRRKGAMTHTQKRRRLGLEQRLGRPDPRAIEHDVFHLLDVVAGSVAPEDTLTLLSDEHPAYPRAVRRLALIRTGPILHRRTPSTDPRTRANDLFPVNLADLLIRHSAADHKRETIAFAKRRQCAAERLVIHLTWRNYIKPRRENGGPDTAAMAAGAAEAPLSFAEILAHRRFPAHTPLPHRWHAYYRRDVRTSAYPRQSEHRLRYAA